MDEPEDDPCEALLEALPAEVLLLLEVSGFLVDVDELGLDDAALLDDALGVCETPETM